MLWLTDNVITMLPIYLSTTNTERLLLEGMFVRNTDLCDITVHNTDLCDITVHNTDLCECDITKTEAAVAQCSWSTKAVQVRD